MIILSVTKLISEMFAPELISSFRLFVNLFKHYLQRIVVILLDKLKSRHLTGLKFYIIGA